MGDEQPSKTDMPGDVRDDMESYCVLLLSPGRARPESLLNDLAERGAQTRVVDNPAHVMVELVQQQGRAVVVVAQPQQMRRLPNLLAAVRRYYPQVTCWRYETINGDGHAELKLFPSEMSSEEPAVDQALLASLEQSNRVSHRPENGHRSNKASGSEKEPGPGPSGRGLGEHDHTAPSALPDALLTPEELSMLMGPDFDDDDSSGDSNVPDDHWSS